MTATRLAIEAGGVLRPVPPILRASVLGLVALTGVLCGQEELRPEKRPGAQGWVDGALRIEPAARQFGDRYQFEEVRETFRVTNAGAVVVFIEEGVAVAGEGTVEVDQALLAPGEATEATVTQQLGAALGEVHYRYALVTDEPGVARYRFSLSGFVQGAYDPPAPEVSLGTVDRETGSTAELELGSREVGRLEQLEVVHLPAGLEVRQSGRAGVASETVRLSFRLLPGAPPGPFRETVRLRTNVIHQPLVEIAVSGTVYGRVVPDRNPVSLGAVEIGRSEETWVTLHGRRGESLEELDIGPVTGPLAVETQACLPPAADCRRLRVLFAPEAKGPWFSQLTVTPGTVDEVLTLHLHGLGLAPGTVVRELEMPAPAGEEGGR